MNRNALTRWNLYVFLSLSVMLLFPGPSFAGDGGYYFQEGTRLLKQAKLDRAVAALTEAIRLVPDHVASYNNRGLAYFELKKYPEAKQDFFTALQFSPDDQQANNNLGILFCGEKDYDQALFYFQKAIKDSKAPTSFDVVVYRNLSFVYMKKGMTEEASEAYEKTREIADSQPNRLSMRPYGEGTEDYTLTLDFSRVRSPRRQQ